MCHYNALSYYCYIASLIIKWMSMEHEWNYTDRGKLSTWIKTCLVPICPPPIPHGLDWHWNLTLAATGWQITHLRYSMAQKLGFLLSYCIRLKVALVLPAINAVSVLHKTKVFCYCIKQWTIMINTNNFVLIKCTLHRKLLVYKLR